MDVTTTKATPTVPLMATPSSTIARVNGGVFRNPFSWRRLQSQATPNRWLSVPRPVGPGSKYWRFGSSPWGDLSPPRAQENMAEKAQPNPVRPRLRWGSSTEADGERECARASPPDPLHRRLDKRSFIDGGRKRTTFRYDTYDRANHQPLEQRFERGEKRTQTTSAAGTALCPASHGAIERPRCPRQRQYYAGAPSLGAGAPSLGGQSRCARPPRQSRPRVNL